MKACLLVFLKKEDDIETGISKYINQRMKVPKDNRILWSKKL